MDRYLKISVAVLLLFCSGIILNAQDSPNILFIIGDDMGVDAIEGFDIGEDHPQTPNLNALRASGLSFSNVWAAPVCSATRASLLTGKYGINNGVNSVPGFLSTEHKSIFQEIKEQSDGLYRTCLVGKWHLSRRYNYDHPLEHGVDEFMGIMGAGVSDYYYWDKVEDGKIEKCTSYVTKYFSDYAIDWINKQDSPWFMWLAHVAPHTPFHLPPEEMYATENPIGNKGKYKAMIESLDYEIGRLLNNIQDTILDNTVIVFLGDNGTPGRIISGFPLRRGKGSVYQGGISVPLIVSGKGVTRANEMEDAMVNISDFYPTFSQLVNGDASGEINDGHSFWSLLDNSQGDERAYNYMAMGANRQIEYSKYAVRDSRYKLIDSGDGTFEFYDLEEDRYEQDNLLAMGLSVREEKAIKALIEKMSEIRGEDIDLGEELGLGEAELISIDDKKAVRTEKSLSYPIIHTGVSDFYDSHSIVSGLDESDALYWQDAGRTNNIPEYTDNGDGTISDDISGLMWQKDMGEKMSYVEAEAAVEALALGGYDDWRIPTIKELYSLILFTGRVMGMNTETAFIDTNYFDQPFGDVSKGERSIDAQTWSSTKYKGTTMNGSETIFGVNFVDGRIKGYPVYNRRKGEDKKMYFRMVRGNSAYGKNDFADNNDGTISDKATGLMWQKTDDGMVRDWESSIEYCEGLELAGYEDWHLPNVKELQSIVDYERSPSATNSKAIDPLFDVSEVLVPDNDAESYSFYWSSTTHLDGRRPYSNGAYVSFGKTLGKMRGNLLDVHGAGAQRSDPKSGNAEDYPMYRGPQGDLVSVYNQCRCVRLERSVVDSQ